MEMATFILWAVFDMVYPFAAFTIAIGLAFFMAFMMFMLLSASEFDKIRKKEKIDALVQLAEKLSADAAPPLEEESV